MSFDELNATSVPTIKVWPYMLKVRGFTGDMWREWQASAARAANHQGQDYFN